MRGVACLWYYDTDKVWILTLQDVGVRDYDLAEFQSADEAGPYLEKWAKDRGLTPTAYQDDAEVRMWEFS